MASRDDLYERIRRSSRDDVILEEMIRLGFWPRSLGPPEDSLDEVRRRDELRHVLGSLLAESARLHDIAKARSDLRKQRMKESRERQKETKPRILRERQLRADAWRALQTRAITYLGEGVSAGLNQVESATALLQNSGLPVIHNAAELADAMGITVPELRFLAFARRASTVTHYVRFRIPKKTGGFRTISAPMPRLKHAQRWILANILERLACHDAAHGFRRGRSIVTNARPHVGADVVVNLDLEGFFPTVHHRRVKGLFRRMGYSEQVATILALLCTEPEISTVELDGTTYHVARGERFLPQGSPASPAITNLICRGLDAALTKIAANLGFRYSRYADDMTFSGSGEAADRVGPLLRRVRFLIDREGFRVHPEKTRILRRGSQQEVTGLIVNDRVNVSRSVLRRFRATLYQIEKDGPEGKRWGDGADVLSSLAGFANFVAMVDPDRGAEFRRRVAIILDRHRPGRH